MELEPRNSKPDATDSLADLDNLPDPDIFAIEIVKNLEAGLESFREIIASLNGKK